MGEAAADLATLRAHATRARRARIKLARIDPAECNRYILRDEETGGRIINGPIHEEWHRNISRHRRLALWSHIESGKTNSISIGRSLFELGTNTELRVCVVSATDKQAVKIVRACSNYIETSEPLREVFPHLAPGAPWTPGAGAITVQRTSRAKDPSIQACGVHGAVLGSRIDLLILDDILRWENVRTEARRAEVLGWYRATLAGRMTAKSRIVILGTPWHPHDLVHQLAKGRGWMSWRYPIANDQGISTWPARFGPDRITDMTDDLGGPGSLEVQRQLYCIASLETSDLCKPEWINLCLDEGAGITLLEGLPLELLPDGAFTVTGVDLATKKKQKASRDGERAGQAKTVLFTILVYPPGHELAGVRQLLKIEAGHWTAPEIRDRVIAHQQAFASVVFVEDNGAQQYLLEIVGEKATIPIWGATTGINKWHPAYGVGSIFNEFQQGKWHIPNDGRVTDPEVTAWLNDCRTFHPSEHTGDYLMACWVAKEGARLLAWQRRQAEDAGGDAGVQVFSVDEMVREEKAARAAEEIERRLRGG